MTLRMLLHEEVSAWKYLWLFEIGRMRNSYLKVVRAEWKGRVPETRICNRLLMSARSTMARTGRLFFGRLRLLALGLVTTSQLEFMPELGKIAKLRIKF